MPFQIKALPFEPFEDLFHLPDEDLAARRAVRVTATQKPGFPCRVSLEDAEPGEELILAHYEHHAVDSPFRAGHAVYIRKDAREAKPAPNHVPELLRSRTLSLRGFDKQGMMVGADLAEGTELEKGIEAMFANPEVEYVHIHFAKPGCYAALAERAA